MDYRELPNNSDWLTAGLAQILHMSVHRATENIISLLTAPGSWEIAIQNNPFQQAHPSQGEITLLYSQPGICVMLCHSYKDFLT